MDGVLFNGGRYENSFSIFNVRTTIVHSRARVIFAEFQRGGGRWGWGRGKTFHEFPSRFSSLSFVLFGPFFLSIFLSSLSPFFFLFFFFKRYATNERKIRPPWLKARVRFVLDNYITLIYIIFFFLSFYLSIRKSRLRDDA